MKKTKKSNPEKTARRKLGADALQAVSGGGGGYIVITTKTGRR